MRIQRPKWQPAASLFTAAFLFVTSGCQSWNANTFPLQNVSRVPPPSTRDFSGAGGYYNNTSSINQPNSYAATAGVSDSGSSAAFPSTSGTLSPPVVTAGSSGFGRSGPMQPTTLNPVSTASYAAPTNTWTNQADFEAASGQSQTGPTVGAEQGAQNWEMPPNLDWR